MTEYEMAKRDGFVDAQLVAIGKAVRTGAPHPRLDMVVGYMKDEGLGSAEDQANRSAAHQSTLNWNCTVDGQPVAELAVLIKPVAFLVTVEHGTHELGRVYFHKEKFAVGVDTQRLGGIGVKHVDYRTDKGLRVTWQHGYEMFIPSAHCQATWKLPD